MSNPAEGYERYMVPVLFAPWASRLVDAANPRPGDRVLDVACGTGIVARQVASRLGAGAAVTGIDANPKMLAVARASADREGARIEWREAAAEQLPFPVGTFDRILCQFGLMFFRDRRAAVAEMRRVAAEPGGRVAVSVWQGLDRHPFYATLHRVIQDRVGISAIQDIFSMGNVDELTALFSSAGFKDVTIESATMTARFPDPGAFLAGEIDVDTAAIPSMQGADLATRERIVNAIAGDMRVPLERVTHDDVVVFDCHAHLLTANVR